MVRVSTGIILFGNNRLIAGVFYWMKDNNKIRGNMNLLSTFILQGLCQKLFLYSDDNSC
jgi:hypothetical protein